MLSRLTPFDHEGEFRRFEIGDQLRRIAVRGAGASVLSKATNFCLQFGSVIVLARLLTPRDFGVVAMVTTFSLLLASFGLNGFTEAIIQWNRLNHLVTSNIFWIIVGVGLALTLAFAASGSLLAWFYHDPLVARVTVGLSPTILLANAGYVHQALLKRAMRFTTVSANQVIGRIVAVAVSISLAFMGWGYWALVAGYVAQQLSLTAGAWMLCRWTPGLPTLQAGSEGMIGFATKVFGRYGLNYFVRNADNLLVGWRFDALTLGFYKKAYDLFALPVSQVISPTEDVALATLSRLQGDQARYVRYLVNSLAIIAFVGMAIAGDLTLTGKDVVRLVLGAKWGESGKIFAFFGPGIGALLLYSCPGWIHLSIGKPERWLRWTLLEFVFTTSLFGMALRWGPAGIAAAWSTSLLVLLIPSFWYAGRPIGLPVSALVRPLWRYAAAALLAAFASAFALSGTSLWAAPSGAEAALVALVAISAVFLTLYVAAIILLYRGIGPLRQIATLLGEFRGRRSEKATVEVA